MSSVQTRFYSGKTRLPFGRDSSRISSTLSAILDNAFRGFAFEDSQLQKRCQISRNLSQRRERKHVRGSQLCNADLIRAASRHVSVTRRRQYFPPGKQTGWSQHTVNLQQNTYNYFVFYDWEPDSECREQCA
jgi:hypothetical protein